MPQKTSSTISTKNLKGFFKDTPVDHALYNYLEFKLQGKGTPEHDLLMSHTVEMIDSISDIYQAMPSEQYKKEHKYLLDIIFEVSQNATEMKQTTEHAKDFLKWVIESKVDPWEAGEPTATLRYWAFLQYTIFEYDELERRRIANLVLDEHRTPEFKEEIEKVLEENHPEKLWPGRRK